MVRHQLGSAGRSYDFAALHTAVDTALNTREQTLVVDLDGVGFIDNAVIRELILALRRLRDRGGSLYVTYTRPSIQSSLCALGLERVLRTATV